jgi:predicted transcriptional regulator
MPNESLNNRILRTLGNDEDRCMSFEELVEIYHGDGIPEMTKALNRLLNKGVVRRFRATYRGNPQNHYELTDRS